MLPVQEAAAAECLPALSLHFLFGEPGTCQPGDNNYRREFAQMKATLSLREGLFQQSYPIKLTIQAVILLARGTPNLDVTLKNTIL